MSDGGWDGLKDLWREGLMEEDRGGGRDGGREPD